MSDSQMPDSKLFIEPCEDVSMLSKLFIELGEDERTDVVRTKEKAFEDMKAFLERGEKAYVFTLGGKPSGYALVNPEQYPPYLHHFYICRDERRRGLGTAAFSLLLKTLDTSDMDLDVFVWNERGKAFWSSLGFKPRAIKMRLKQC